jgi:hypothetical protein
LATIRASCHHGGLFIHQHANRRLVTEDVYHHGQLIIPSGTEVHGSATVDRIRERIASDGRWTLVWQDGEELSVSGLALDHERDADTGTWAITDGSAGLRGRLIKSDNLAEVKLYAAGAPERSRGRFTEKNTSPFGSFALPSLQNASLKGAQGVLDRYAQQILTTIERDGFYVRVPAGSNSTSTSPKRSTRTMPRSAGLTRCKHPHPLIAPRLRQLPRRLESLVFAVRLRRCERQPLRRRRHAASL